jgi:hypothetical protein
MAVVYMHILRFLATSLHATLYYLLNTIKTINSWSIRWVIHVARMEIIITAVRTSNAISKIMHSSRSPSTKSFAFACFGHYWIIIRNHIAGTVKNRFTYFFWWNISCYYLLVIIKGRSQGFCTVTEQVIFWPLCNEWLNWMCQWVNLFIISNWRYKKLRPWWLSSCVKPFHQLQHTPVSGILLCCLRRFLHSPVKWV